MKAKGPAVSLLVVSAILVAGCADDGAKTEAGSGLSAEAAQAEFDETTGAIRGSVLTIEAFPIPGAGLLLQPGDHRTLSSQDGSYSFSRLPPGMYQIFAGKVGFEAVVKTVQVPAGELTPLDLQLQELIVYEPRQVIWGPTASYLQCYMSTFYSSGPCGFLPFVGWPYPDPVDPWANNDNRLEFQLQSDDWTQIVMEAEWTPSTAATNPKMTQIFSYAGRSSTHWFANATPSEGRTSFTYTRGAQGPGGQLPGNQPSEPNMNLTLITWITLPFGTATPDNFHPVNVAYEMTFSMYATVFYSKPAPPNYSAFEP